MSRSLDDVAAEVQRCVYAWEHDARIIGNVTAVELRLLIRERDALITRLRAAEARIERVGAILSDAGCDCYCDCDSDGHNADCDLCLACRIDREVSP